MDFATVAHDLRTPLNVVLAHVRLLAAERLSDFGRRRLDIMEIQIQRMARLLDSCVGQPNRLAWTTLVDLNATIQNVVSELQAVLEDRQIEVVVSADEVLPPMLGDADALHRVLVNVFVNSADAISGGGHILVSARCDQGAGANGAVVQIDVTDTGSGIPAELIPSVFEAGFTTKRSGQGSGLGLGICREIIQMHGGRIDLFSEQGKGTTVRLLLPVLRPLYGSDGEFCTRCESV